MFKKLGLYIKKVLYLQCQAIKLTKKPYIMSRLNSELTLLQDALNKANAKQDFTVKLPSAFNGKFIVSHESLYIGENPSICFDLIIKIGKAIDDKYDSIGGWFDKKTGLYHVDANLHYLYHETANVAARIMNQVSYYDSSSGEVVYV